MADQISFSTGLKTFDINGAVELSFNPTDSAFVERLFKTFEELDKKQEEQKAEIAKAKDNEIFDIARKRNDEMRGMIDAAFGAPVCDALFGSMNVWALADGLPVWANFLLAIMEEIDTSFAQSQKLANTRIRKYSEKYKKNPNLGKAEK